jgi:hypothetical protein
VEFHRVDVIVNIDAYVSDHIGKRYRIVGSFVLFILVQLNQWIWIETSLSRVLGLEVGGVEVDDRSGSFTRLTYHDDGCGCDGGCRGLGTCEESLLGVSVELTRDILAFHIGGFRGANFCASSHTWGAQG